MTRRWPVVEAFDALDAALTTSSPVAWLDEPAGDPLFVLAVIAATEIALDGRAVSYSLEPQGDRIAVRAVLRGRAESVPVVLGFTRAAPLA